MNELDGFEVVGAGAGEFGSNIDVEVDDTIPRAHVISMAASVLRQFGSHDAAHMRLSDTGERINAADVEA